MRYDRAACAVASSAPSADERSDSWLDRCRLQLPQVSIEAVLAGKQRLMHAFLDNAAILHTDNTVAMAHRCQSVRDDDDGASPDDLTHVGKDDPLALIVERAGRLVEDED